MIRFLQLVCLAAIAWGVLVGPLTPAQKTEAEIAAAAAAAKAAKRIENYCKYINPEFSACTSSTTQ